MSYEALIRFCVQRPCEFSTHAKTRFPLHCLGFRAILCTRIAALRPSGSAALELSLIAQHEHES
ncbi:hypothetical protein CBM2638_U30003 [Cupriavidus taiwanensis]|uniref:Uncharacterized protein n=1 Tax=Cupriavidus taiwanensis TaxID=164546 RepID=A0A375FHP9_9BURK|nr:hypothetical protein CBM2638_U30003 [Cupriavidus taiwanensis]SPD48995.1 protein of unknown function [Cupriavidus taiwanensis]